MKDFPSGPSEMFLSLWRNRDLILASVRREVIGRYKGSVIGIAWSFFNPLLMLTIYTFVFSEVFKARWGTVEESRVTFALLLFAGLIVFNLFAESISRAPGLILSNVNYVKKVVFPLEILPVISVCASLFHAAISLAVWLLAYFLMFGPPHVSILYLPILLIPFVFFVVGLSWILASLGVFLRDVSHFVGIATTALMFLSPIFYPATALPETYRQFIYLNPMTLIIEETRQVLFWGNPPNLNEALILWLTSLTIALCGFSWFQKTRKGFADVL